jgi:hypothetical protein
MDWIRGAVLREAPTLRSGWLGGARLLTDLFEQLLRQRDRYRCGGKIAVIQGAESVVDCSRRPCQKMTRWRTA